MYKQLKFTFFFLTFISFSVLIHEFIHYIQLYYYYQIPPSQVSLHFFWELNPSAISLHSFPLAWVEYPRQTFCPHHYLIMEVPAYIIQFVMIVLCLKFLDKKLLQTQER